MSKWRIVLSDSEGIPRLQEEWKCPRCHCKNREMARIKNIGKFVISLCEQCAQNALRICTVTKSAIPVPLGEVLFVEPIKRRLEENARKSSSSN